MTYRQPPKDTNATAATSRWALFKANLKENEGPLWALLFIPFALVAFAAKVVLFPVTLAIAISNNIRGLLVDPPEWMIPRGDVAFLVCASVWVLLLLPVVYFLAGWIFG